MLIRHLPEGAALYRQGHTWQLEHWMLAEILDALHGANWQRAGKKTARRPQPVPRPSDRRPERMSLSRAEQARRLRRQIEAQEVTP